MTRLLLRSRKGALPVAKILHGIVCCVDRNEKFPPQCTSCTHAGRGETPLVSLVMKVKSGLKGGVVMVQCATHIAPVFVLKHVCRFVQMTTNFAPGRRTRKVSVAGRDLFELLRFNMMEHSKIAPARRTRGGTVAKRDQIVLVRLHQRVALAEGLISAHSESDRVQERLSRHDVVSST